MFMKRLQRDKRGLTLIELVCAIAILGIITATVGGAMVVATNSYRQGTTDAALQQEAQFTANTIESLIIDSTNEVSFDSDNGKLIIKNEDYTYVITWDSTAQTLYYSQYNTVDDSEVALDQLLAEHVSHFNVIADNFAVTRNAQIELGMENQGQSFRTDYNITSRNAPDAAVAPPVDASIMCDPEVVLEPLEKYVFPVTIMGPTNTDFSVTLSDGDRALNMTATPTSGGVKFEVGKDETGGPDGLVNMLITTDARDASGDPWTKSVIVNIRRVTAIDVSTPVIVNGGTAAKAGTEYEMTATLSGTNLDQNFSANHDDDYVSPYTQRWAFTMSDGSAAPVTVDVGTGDRGSVIRFTLNEDIKAGNSLTITGYALHPEGIDGTETTNKTGKVYATVHDEEVIMVAKSGLTVDSLIRRGIETEVKVELDKKEMVKANWIATYGSYDETKDAYNDNFTGNVYYRFRPKDEDLTKADIGVSAGYPNWIKFTDQGNTATYIKFNAADFTEMMFMEDYLFEIAYSFKWVKNGVEYTYPLNFDPSKPDSIADEYIYTFPINAMQVKFADSLKLTNGTGNSINLTPYLNEEKDGIGTKDNPLILPEKANFDLEYSLILGAAASRSEVNQVFKMADSEEGLGAKIYELAGSQWVYKKNLKVELGQSPSGNERGTIKFNTANFFNDNGFMKGRTYKIVLGEVTSPYSAKHGAEEYADDNVTGASGRGLIYFKFE